MKAFLASIFIVVLLIVGVWLFDRNVIDDSHATRNKVAKCFVQQTLRTPLTRFQMDCGRYPTSDEGLRALVICPSGLKAVWRGPYIDPDTPLLDPWHHAYRYRSPGIRHPTAYDLWSTWSDGIDSADDITI